MQNVSFRHLLFLILLVASAFVTRAQESSHTDSLETAPPDSAKMLVQLQEMLDEARLNEANLRLEIEHMKVAEAEADSLRRSRLLHRIDSLRASTPGAHVIVEGDTLFTLYAKSGGWSAPYRASTAVKEIETLGKSFSLNPDSVYIERSEYLTDVMYGQRVIVSFSDNDALWAATSRDSLASDTRQIIVDKLHLMQQEHGLWQLIRRLLYTALIIALLLLAIRFIRRAFRRIVYNVMHLSDSRLKPFYIQNLELLNVAKQKQLLLLAVKLLRLLTFALVLLIAVPMLFWLFPPTKELAYKMLSYILDPIINIVGSIVAYIPNLFTIIVICLAVRYLVKLLRFLATEVESEHLHFSGFYPDWALPTFYIIRFLLYAFMIAMIYPYLPGSNSGIFQGISVFLDLIVSLGSSSVIGNIIGGFVITYMRPFKMGDRISLKDTTGNVIEKTPLVTRLRTPKNEVVTIPNSFIMSSQTINYTQSAREFGLIVHTEVAVGYEVDWQRVHDLLIEAALNTPGVVDDPRPFVLETQLHDYYPVYQVNAYVRNVNVLDDIYSNLHQNIQRIFAREGIELLSPHYTSVRDGNSSTVPPTSVS